MFANIFYVVFAPVLSVFGETYAQTKLLKATSEYSEARQYLDDQALEYQKHIFTEPGKPLQCPPDEDHDLQDFLTTIIQYVPN